MRGTHPTRTPLSSYRDAITQLLNAGERFGDVEDAIDEAPNLTQDEKAALWLLAFSLRPPADQQLDAHAHIAALQYRGGQTGVPIGDGKALQS